VPIRRAPFSMLTKSLIFLPLCLQQDSLYTQQGLQILLVPGFHMHLMWGTGNHGTSTVCLWKLLVQDMSTSRACSPPSSLPTLGNHITVITFLTLTSCSSFYFLQVAPHRKWYYSSCKK
jgi:hypothetical protein